MRKGVLIRVRSMRRWCAQAVVLALVLPALLGLLPQPAYSAADALERDLAVSVCGKDMPLQQDGGQQHRSHDHCVLCASHCASHGPGSLPAGPAFAALPPSAAIPELATTQALAPPLQALLDASPPRAPPLSC